MTDLENLIIHTREKNKKLDTLETCSDGKLMVMSWRVGQKNPFTIQDYYVFDKTGKTCFHSMHYAAAINYYNHNIERREEDD